MLTSLPPIQDITSSPTKEENQEFFCVHGQQHPISNMQPISESRMTNQKHCKHKEADATEADSMNSPKLHSSQNKNIRGNSRLRSVTTGFGGSNRTFSSGGCDAISHREDIDNDRTARSSRDYDDVTSFQMSPTTMVFVQSNSNQGINEEEQEWSSGGGGGSDDDGDSNYTNDGDNDDNIQDFYDEEKESTSRSKIYSQRVVEALLEYQFHPNSLVFQSFCTILESFGDGEFGIKKMTQIVEKLDFHEHHKALFSGRRFRRYFLFPYLRSAQRRRDSAMRLPSQEYSSP